LGSDVKKDLEDDMPIDTRHPREIRARSSSQALDVTSLSLEVY
jgi:hypothetical protein